MNVPPGEGSSSWWWSTAASAPRSAAPQAFESQAAASLCSAEAGSSAAAVVDRRWLRLRLTSEPGDTYFLNVCETDKVMASRSALTRELNRRDHRARRAGALRGR
jgi:hypothetical protein